MAAGCAGMGVQPYVLNLPPPHMLAGLLATYLLTCYPHAMTLQTMFHQKTTTLMDV
jgi:hypothetical protein